MMESFSRIQYLKLAHKRFQLREFSTSRKLSFDFDIKDHFPEMSKLRIKYLSEKLTEDTHKTFLCKELLEECNLYKSSFYLCGFERKYIMSMNITSLEKHGLIKPGTDKFNVMNRFLSYLEPFPFDSTYIMQTENLTMGMIRDYVEKQYLAWKYKVNWSHMNNIFLRLQSSFFIGRSVRNLRRNSMILDMVPNNLGLNLSKKIYLINQVPFSVLLVLKFQEVFQHKNWKSFLSMCQKSCYSFKHICFLTQILETMGFSNKQIWQGAPYLNISFETFIDRMNVILSHPALLHYKKHDQFLSFLEYSPVHIMNLEDKFFPSFAGLKVKLYAISNQLELNHKTKRITGALIKYHSAFYLEIDDKHLEILKRHRNFSLLTEHQLNSTLWFLEKNKFSETEILESIIIILYPSNVISKALKKISEEEEFLKEIGFVKGCVSEETNLFKAGTISKRKTLQLCLYYIEKEFNFSWDAISQF